MDSFNPYGRQQDPNYGPRSAAAAQHVHVGGGHYRQSSASTHLHSARPACVEPRPLVQTGPQGDSLPACGTRRRRRPSRLERARRREAHWTVAASPRLEKPASQSQEPRNSALAQSTLPSSVCSDRRALSSHHEFGYSSFSWSARARALVSTPALAAARSSYRPAAKGPREDRRAPAPPFPCGSSSSR